MKFFGYFKTAPLLLLAGAVVAAEAEAPFIEAEIAYAKEACDGLGDFELVIENVVKELPDLNRDGRAEIAVDHSGFVCHGAYSIYGGSAGHPLIVLVSRDEGFTRFRFQARSWRVIGPSNTDGGDTILLLLIHGTACGGAGSDPCYEALAWKGDRIFVVKPRP